MSYQTVKLAAGVHSPDEGWGCLLEIVSMLAGEKFSDRPQCACPIISAFARGTNDWMNDEERQLLWPFTTRLVDSKADDIVEQARTYRIADWLLREVDPLAFELAGYPAEADNIRALAPITNEETARWAWLNFRSISKESCSARVTTVSHFARFVERNSLPLAIRVASYASLAADIHGFSDRSKLVQMRIDLLDELLPAAPIPADAVASALAEELQATASSYA